MLPVNLPPGGIFTSNKLARGPVVLRVNLPRKGARVRPPHGRVLTRVRTIYDRQTYMPPGQSMTREGALSRQVHE